MAFSLISEKKVLARFSTKSSSITEAYSLKPLKSSSFFNYFGKCLVEQVDFLVGCRALDVATGKRAVLFPLAQVIGPLGKVIGITQNS